MEIVFSIAGRIVDSLYDVTVRQLRYLVEYNENVDKLRKQAEKLSDMKARILGKVDAATRNAEQIENDVDKWMARVDHAVEEAENFLEGEGKAEKKCIHGWCVNPSLRYRLSKEAYEKSLAIAELQEEGTFESVSRGALPPKMIPSSTGLFGFRSRQAVTKEIIEILASENVSLIGICGMGGVGKTTMVNEIGIKAKEEKLFEEVVMAVVSQTPSISKIQEEIAKMLGLTLAGSNESERARQLWARMEKQKRILVILDDVWSRLELSDVGIPSGNMYKGIKVIFTSRSAEIGREMDAQRIVKVEVLSKEESWVLFRETAGGVVDSQDINPIAREIAAKCGGLPIALVTVGRALRDKSKYVWVDAARQLKKSAPTNIRGVEAKLFLPLELSYNSLETTEAKSCFLLCCLFPEDSNIPLENLLRYGISLRTFQDVDTLEEARSRLHTVVSTLIDSHLLLKGTKEKHVRMHDVIRDVAIYISSKNKNTFLVKSGTGMRDWPNYDSFGHITGISLMSNDIHDLPDGLECPKLEILLLSNNYRLTMPDSFFQGMKELKLLDMGNFMNISEPLPLPPSIGNLENLRTLCIDYRRLRNISVIGRLVKLEVLSISGSDIEEIPEEFRQLTSLKMFDVSYCWDLRLISPGIFSNLRKLEELSMSCSFTNWDIQNDSKTNASISELQFLTRLTSIDIRIPHASVLTEDMPFYNLTSYNISIANIRDTKTDIFSRTLSLSHDTRFGLLPWIENLVLRSEHLHLLGFVGLRDILHDLVNEGFNELKAIDFMSCNELKYFLDTSDRAANIVFRNLEQLSFGENLVFTEICHGHLPDESLNKVTMLSVRECHKMGCILPSHLMQRLQILKNVYVSYCDSLLNVFEIEGFVTKEHEDVKILSMLEELSLDHLQEMTCIWKGQIQFINLCSLKSFRMDRCRKLKWVFPRILSQTLASIERIVINSCDNLEEIFRMTEEKEAEEEIMVWNRNNNLVSPSLQTLTYLDISFCDNLRSLFSLSLVRSLVQLEHLEVHSCKKIKEIVSIDHKEEAETTEKIVFPRMLHMTLQALSSLACFCPSRCTIEWPALKYLTVDICPEMETFGYGDQITPELHNVQVKIGEWLWRGDINATVQYVFKEGFSSWARLPTAEPAS